MDPEITLTKTADAATYAAIDDVITYTFVAKNTGNVTLTDVTIDDTGLTGLYDWNCNPTGTVDLAPLGELTCTAKYKVAQADIDAGEVVNTATASGQPPSGERVDDDDSETVDGPAMDPGIKLTKTASPSTYTEVGDVISYTLVATNTGNVTLTDVTVTDPLLNYLSCGTDTTLEPDDTGDSLTCTATYTITQADVDAGQFVNTATASGQPPSGERVDDDDSAEVKKVAISLTKTADVATYKAVGDVITYTFVATNTGNVELTNVDIADPMSGLSSLDCGPDTLPTTLATGASVTCTATYTVTQADMDADKIDNTAHVTGEDPDDNEITAEDSETVDKIAISLTKTADPEVFTQVGEIITYSFVVENTGNLTLYNVNISDLLPDLSGLDCGSTTLPTFLGPDATITCTATYQIKQSDIDRGFVENAATATGEDEGGQTVDDDDDAAVEGPKEGASIALVKSADPEIFVAVGDLITYTFTATNDGPFSLTNVTISDPLPGLSALSCSESLPTSLLPGETVTCEATYSITQDDIDNGVLDNTAVATGTGLNEEVVEDDDGKVIEGPKQEASIHLDKRAEPATYNAVGDEIVYSFVVTNNGIYTLYDVTVTDPLFGLSFGPIDTLEPGESKTYKYTYTITQADLDARSIQNVATAMAYDPDENPVSSTDEEIVERPEPKKVESLPTTGFAPNQITSLPPQSLDKSYTAYSDFWLEIPSLGVSVDILGVPKSNYGWDVTWLDDEAGWLDGTTFPTWPGNSVVTAHVWDAFDKAGPFVDLNELQWGDKVIVHLNGASHIFEVRSKHTVRPDDMSLVEREEEYAWLNLLTCQGFDEESDVYQYRLIVRAVLVDVE
jgi:LPXTG-site transpeptidase (sortase) family protein